MRGIRHLEVGHVERTRLTTGFYEHLGFVHLTHLHAEFFPFLEVSRNVDMTARTGSLTLAEVLWESLVILDRGGVVALVLVNFVGCTINRKLTYTPAQKIYARFAEPVVHDVEFYERIDCPTVAPILPVALEPSRPLSVFTWPW